MEQNITLSFTVAEVNFILSCLAKMPYEQVFFLMQNIKQQAEKQVTQANEETK